MKQTLNKIFLVALFLFVVILIPNHKASATTYTVITSGADHYNRTIIGYEKPSIKDGPIYDNTTGYSYMFTINSDKDTYLVGERLIVSFMAVDNVCDNTQVDMSTDVALWKSGTSANEKITKITVVMSNIIHNLGADLANIRAAYSTLTYSDSLMNPGSYYLYITAHVKETWGNDIRNMTFDFPGPSFVVKGIPVVTVRKSSANIITYGTSDTITWQSTYATSCACTMSKKGVVSACVDENNTPVGSGPDGTFKTKRLTSDATFSVTCTN